MKNYIETNHNLTTMDKHSNKLMQSSKNYYYYKWDEESI